MMRVMTDSELPREGAHLTDGHLLFVAAERHDVARGAPPGVEDDTTREWTRHLDGCAECGRRLALLDRRAQRMSALVAQIDLPPDFRYPALRPRRRPQVGWRQVGWLRAAAAILLVLAPLALVPPVRAWALGWASAQWTRIADRRTSDRRAASSPVRGRTPAARPTSSRIGFTPSGDELFIVLASRQADGAVVLTTTSAPEVAFEIVGGGGETPVVHASGLRIPNVVASRASYYVALPPAVRRVHVRVGVRPPVLVERARVGREVRLDLR
jgi:hypothetical protein